MYIDDEDFVLMLRDDNDIYSSMALEQMEDDGEITPEEAAFMQGYNEAM